jgi:tRNA(Ile)-lysidine synthase
LKKPDNCFSPACLETLLFREWRLPADARFRIAYSGGLDSHVLLHAVATLRARYPISLDAIYIDHGLQAGSKAWGDHCARICRQLSVPFRELAITVTTVARDGLEAAARRVRYQALAGQLKPGDFLLTAHQRDDQAETVLLQLLRGAGTAGLAAMPDRTPFGPGELLRPLLGFPRAALRVYAQAQHLDWIEDPSNQDLHRRRNYLRAEIVPRLERHWPDAREMLVRTARHLAEAQALLEEMAGDDLAACRHPEGRRYPEALSAAAVARLPPARQRNLLRHWLRRQDYLAPEYRQLDELLKRIRQESRSRQACVHWQGVEVWRYRDCLVALPATNRPDAGLDAAWDLKAPLTLSGIGTLTAMAVQGQGLSRRRLEHTGLRVRLRRGGENLQLPGHRHHHLLKKLLQAQGVPPWERLRLPLLFANGELAAVADNWISHAFVASPGEEGLKITWEPFSGPANDPVEIR